MSNSGWVLTWNIVAIHHYSNKVFINNVNQCQYWSFKAKQGSTIRLWILFSRVQYSWKVKQVSHIFIFFYIFIHLHTSLYIFIHLLTSSYIFIHLHISSYIFYFYSSFISKITEQILWRYWLHHRQHWRWHQWRQHHPWHIPSQGLGGGWSGLETIGDDQDSSEDGCYENKTESGDETDPTVSKGRGNMSGE